MNIPSLEECKARFYDRIELACSYEFVAIPGCLWVLEANFGLLESISEFLDVYLELYEQEKEMKTEKEGEGAVEGKEMEEESREGLIAPPCSEASDTEGGSLGC